MSKILTHGITPSSVGNDLVRHEEDYDYGQIVKGIIHAWIIPFIIAFVDPAYSLVYIACAGLLYSTVFSDKSDGFFGAVMFSMLIIAIMMIPN